MKKQIRNVDINSEILNWIQEKIQNKIFQFQNSSTFTQNNLLNYILIFENNSSFKKISLISWDILFDEWDINDNLYIIESWILSVEKYTTQEKLETKKLAVLKPGDFLWEWWLDQKSQKKEVLVKALTDTKLIAINIPKDLKKFLKQNTTVGFGILKYIISQTNKRLLEANKIITSNYEIQKNISTLTSINSKSIFNLIDKIKTVIWVEYILYFEKHQTIQNLLTLKYNSRQPNKMQDLVFERAWYFLDLDELFEKCNIKKNDNIIINKLNIWKEVYWYLILVRKKSSFSWSDKKIFLSIANSFSWVIKKFLSDKEDYNRIYINENKKI